MKNLDEQPIKLKRIIGRVVKHNRGFSFLEFTISLQNAGPLCDFVVFVLDFRFTFYSSTSHSSHLPWDNTSVLHEATSVLHRDSLRPLQATGLHLFP